MTYLLVECGVLLGEDEEGCHRDPAHDDDLSHEEEEVCDLVEHEGTDGVAHEEEEGVLGGGAEVLPVDGRHDVRVPVDVLHELLETPEATPAAAQNPLRYWVLPERDDRLSPCVHVLKQLPFPPLTLTRTP